MKALVSIKSVIGSLILLCVGLRVLASIVQPALPLLVVFFCLVGIVLWAFFPGRRL